MWIQRPNTRFECTVEELGQISIGMQVRLGYLIEVDTKYKSVELKPWHAEVVRYFNLIELAPKPRHELQWERRHDLDAPWT